MNVEKNQSNLHSPLTLDAEQWSRNRQIQKKMIKHEVSMKQKQLFLKLFFIVLSCTFCISSCSSDDIATDPDIISDEEFLFEALERGNKREAQKVILKRKINVNEHTPIIFKYIYSVDMLEFLINEFKLDIHFTESDSVTSLHLAQNTSIAKYLLDNGLDIEAKDKRKKTPLFYAVYSYRHDVAEFLFGQGANPYAKETSFNRTPLSVLKHQLSQLEIEYELGYSTLEYQNKIKRLIKLFESSEYNPEPKKSFFSKFFDYFK